MILQAMPYPAALGPVIGDDVLLLIDATDDLDDTTSFTDLSNYSRTVSRNGDTRVLNGKIEFDGTGDYLSTADFSGIGPTDSFTIELFGLVVDSFSSNRAFVAQDGAWWVGSVGSSLALSIDTAAGLSLHSSLPLGTPIDLAIVYDGSGFQIYVDANREANVYGVNTDNWVDVTTALKFGNESSGPRELDGRIAGIAVYDSALYSGPTRTIQSFPLYTPPSFTVAPTIASNNGFIGVSDTFTVTPGATSPGNGTRTYQWRRDGVNISGATSTSYTTTGDDLGASITCRETSTNTWGAASSTSNALGPIVTPTYQTDTRIAGADTRIAGADTRVIETRIA